MVFLVLPKVDLVVMVALVLLQVVTTLLLWLFGALLNVLKHKLFSPETARRKGVSDNNSHREQLALFIGQGFPFRDTKLFLSEITMGYLYYSIQTLLYRSREYLYWSQLYGFRGFQCIPSMV